MSRADYAHWNEDAEYMWWMEEGRHPEEPPEPNDDHYSQDEDPEDYCDGCGEYFEDCECEMDEDGEPTRCEACVRRTGHLR